MNLREWALPVYTILIQLATGSLLCVWLIRAFYQSRVSVGQLDKIFRNPLLIIFSTVAFGVIGAHFHLSRPMFSLFAVLNVRTSWLSREIVFTIILFLLLGALVALHWYLPGWNGLKTVLGWGAILSGFATVYCMSQIYLLPTQKTWDSPLTILIYLASMLVMGPPSVLVIQLLDLNFSKSQLAVEVGNYRKIYKEAAPWLIRTTLIAGVVVIALGVYQNLVLQRVQDPSTQVSLQLLFEIYQPLLFFRYGLLVIAAVLLLVWHSRIARGKASLDVLIGPGYIACLMILVSEIMGRFLFYAAHVRVGI